jgi:hypothetical protein
VLLANPNLKTQQPRYRQIVQATKARTPSDEIKKKHQDEVEHHVGLVRKQSRGDLEVVDQQGGSNSGKHRKSESPPAGKHATESPVAAVTFSSDGGMTPRSLVSMSSPGSPSGSAAVTELTFDSVLDRKRPVGSPLSPRECSDSDDDPIQLSPKVP